MARLVHDRDGRPWSVGSQAHLAGPETRGLPVQPADAVLRAILLGMSALLVLVVLLSTPATLWLPGWATGPVLFVAAAIVIVWVLSRPWSVTATTGGTLETGEGIAETAGDAVELGEGEVVVRWVTGPWAAHRELVALSVELAAWSSVTVRDAAEDLPFRS